MMRSLKRVFLLVLLVLAPALPARAARLKDLVAIEGVRDNQLVGYGLVVGLAGKGDTKQATFSAQSLTNMLERMGVSVAPSAIRVANTAAVLVTATLPAFAQPGMHIDITAAAIGDASNLQGGILVLTSLRGADGQVYAVAQGPVMTGGFSAGRGGSSQTVNHPTVGRGLGAATVETTRTFRRAERHGPPPVAAVRLHHNLSHRRSGEPQIRCRKAAGERRKLRAGQCRRAARLRHPRHRSSSPSWKTSPSRPTAPRAW